ncbi:MAG: uncharacterized protein QG670_2286, partial [Thermoproteota archaeon]|nr:uncharacterized protein [Thermoproteota archaeon]
MSSKTWIRFLFKPELREPLAIVGSPGLRSVGQLVIEDLVRSLKANQIAELYSSHFPILYQTSPSYSPVPEFPGEPGVIIDDKNVKLPRIEFYYSPVPSIIIVKGYHANFYG